VRFLRKRRKAEGELTFTAAAEPPWPGACFAGVLGLFAVLVVAGVNLPPEVFPFLIPMGAALALTWVVGKRTSRGNVDVFDGGSGREIRLWDGRRAAGVQLHELASVSREQEGEPPALTLTDLCGSSVTIPLGLWAQEDRMLEVIDHARKETGASGGVGHPVHVHKPAWIAPARIAFLLIIAASIVTVVSQLPQDESEPSAELVTPARIAETAGRPTSPFAGSRPCNVYVVPLDRPSEERANDLARALAERVSLLPCAMPSAAIDPQALDAGRAQLDGAALAVDLFDLFVAEWEDRPSTVVGITEHDLFSSEERGPSFVFGASFGNDALQGFGVISTARMGTGDGLERRLETMAMRYVGLYYFGLETSEDASSALYHTIMSRDDLDRMRPQFADPQPSDLDLRQARARYLATRQ